ncbi:MAG: hypothetical protein ACRDWI_02140 [Jiangellaceae bacterium]
MTYPRAPRGDDADVLPGVTISDSYRLLEDPTAEATVAWSRAQADLLTRHRQRWDTLGAFRGRLTQLLRSGSGRPPGGATAPSTPDERPTRSTPSC